MLITPEESGKVVKRDVNNNPPRIASRRAIWGALGPRCGWEFKTHEYNLLDFVANYCGLGFSPGGCLLRTLASGIVVENPLGNDVFWGVYYILIKHSGVRGVQTLFLGRGRNATLKQAHLEVLETGSQSQKACRNP